MRLYPNATLEDDARRGRARLITRLQALPAAERQRALQAVDDWGDTLLHRAATSPHNATTIAALAALGADLDAPGQGGLPPRLTAAAFGRADNAAALEALGASAQLGPMTEADWRLYLAQVMGLAGPVQLDGVVYALDGALAEGVFAPLAVAFAEFCARTPQVPAATAARIATALRAAPEQLLLSAEAIAEQVSAGAAVVLPSGWTGHATVHVFDGPWAVLCQRSADSPWHRHSAGARPGRSPYFGMDATAPAPIIGAALQRRNGGALGGVVCLAWLALRHRLPAKHPLRRALRACSSQPLRGRRCAVASAKAAVLALLLLEAHRSDPEAGLEQAAPWRALYKQFTTYLRYHALHAYMQRHMPGDGPPDWELVDQAHDRLRASGRLTELPELAQALHADRAALEAAWPSE